MINTFLQRLWSSLLFIGICTLLLLFYQVYVVHGLIILAIATLSALGIGEYLQLARKKLNGISFYPVVLVSFLVTASFGTPFAFWVLCAGCFFLFAYHFRCIEGALLHLAVSFFGLVYIALPLGLSLSLLYSPLGEGRLWMVYLIAVTKSTDIAGYIGGSLLGKRKCAPLVSPSKTIVGAFCGVVASIGVSFCFAPLLSFKGGSWLILGLLLGLAAMFGDLSESLLKRDAGVKDSGSLPGIGGVLDLLDSLLFTTPLVYLYYMVFR